METTYSPNRDLCVVKRKEHETTASGIIVPATNEESGDMVLGVVLAVGAGKLTANGITVPHVVQVGDTVLFSFFDKQKVPFSENVYLVDVEQVAASVVNAE